ncbi:hypothetical protein AnigIFM60653_002011 [Aspergillus niger]|nr:hypothetical protein AnigIFM50267_011385 [Aspergillus niger]GLA02537.1 hypothetical protein AnigIFM60653_002011 [Aspergillus niger]GLA43491.1 hypothetical protein AnigIFM63309_001419 [Aspergillus niger]
MHERYGPIVQITPDELHVSDPAYYKHLFVTGGSRKTDMHPGAFRGTHFEDRYFSRTSMMAAEPRVVSCIKRFTSRLDEFKDTGKPVNMNYAMLSLTVDLVSSIVCEKPTRYLSDPDFNAAWFRARMKGMMAVPALAMLPEPIRSLCMRFVQFLSSRASARMPYADCKFEKSFKDSLRPSPTVNFDNTKQAEAPKQRFGDDIYDQGGQLIQEGGIYPMSNCLQTIILHMALNHEKREKLQKEIKTFLTENPGSEVTWKGLEKLPYLDACLKESLRLAGGRLKRATRVFPENDSYVAGWTVPKGIAVGMSSHWMHMDAEVFPKPEEFKPERWLQSGKGQNPLASEYLVPYSKGSRDCLGKYLDENSVVHMGLCHIIFELYKPDAPRLELFETDEDTMKMGRGYIVSLPGKDSEGVRVLVHSTA